MEASYLYTVVYIVAAIISCMFVLQMVLKKRLSDVQMEETDLRLTYKRYMELYPYSTISYAEYKRLQAERAFKRAVGSEKIKRMVR